MMIIFPIYPTVDPAFRLNAFPTRMASSIFVLFLNGKQNKKEKP